MVSQAIYLPERKLETPFFEQPNAFILEQPVAVWPRPPHP